MFWKGFAEAFWGSGKVLSDLGDIYKDVRFKIIP